MAAHPSSKSTASLILVVHQVLKVHSFLLSVINKDIEKYHTSPSPLRETTCYCYRSPFGHRTIDCNCLHVAIQPVPYSSNNLSMKPISLLFSKKDLVWDLVKGLAEVKIEVMSCSSVIHQHSHSITEVTRLFRELWTL